MANHSHLVKIAIDTIETAITNDDLPTASKLIYQLPNTIPLELEVHRLHAELQLKGNNLLEAEKHINAAILLDDTNTKLYELKFRVLKQSSKYDEALKVINSAIALTPSCITFKLSKAQILHELNRLGEGIKLIKEINSSADNHLYATALEASFLKLVGENYQSIEILEDLCIKQPNNLSLKTTLCLSLLNHHLTTNSQLKIATQEASRLLPLFPVSPIIRKKPENRTIKLAYVSGDFKEHPVAYFLEGVLENHDRSKFEIYLISTVSEQDSRTIVYKKKADHWISISNTNDPDAIEAIRAEHIDIAIDLSGWTRGNRLALFENRIAPVQITWIGYSGSTGLNNMDYIICDNNVLPVENEKHFSETPIRMPNCYLSLKSPHNLLPKLPERPHPKPDRIIFGSFNTLAKLNPEVINAYTEILEKVNGSMLVLRNQQLNDTSVKNHILRKFEFKNIHPSRILLEGNNTRKGMLAAYRKIDIGLDPFPYGGTTTTFEALCMGVPVITLKGDTWVNRVGASILKTINCEELIGLSKTEYVDKATALANNIECLKDLRLNIGQRMHYSPLCNTKQFTQYLENELIKVWNK